jgi:hypothetical protein
MGRGFTAEELEWIISNYKHIGPKRIAEKYDKNYDSVKSYIKKLRDRMRAAGDERWELLDARGVVKRSNQSRKLEVLRRDEVMYYGPCTKTPPIEGKYGLCPVWLVITDPAYSKALQDRLG